MLHLVIIMYWGADPNIEEKLNPDLYLKEKPNPDPYLEYKPDPDPNLEEKPDPYQTLKTHKFGHDPSLLIMINQNC